MFEKILLYLILYLTLGIMADYVYSNYVLKDENIQLSKRIFHILFWLPCSALYVTFSMFLTAMENR